MKLVLVSLVIVNLVYFLWQVLPWETIPWLNTPATSEVAAVATRVDPVPAITLSSETKEQRRINNPIANEGCRAIGPFDDILSGQNVLERLAVLQRVFHLQAIDEPTGEYDFRVMLPPTNSREEAYRKLRELQSQQIDVHIITEGRDALSISLGIFSSLETATATRLNLAASGYESIVTRIPGMDRSYWIFAEDMSSPGIPDYLLQELQSEYEIAFTDMSCLGSE